MHFTEYADFKNISFTKNMRCGFSSFPSLPPLERYNFENYEVKWFYGGFFCLVFLGRGMVGGCLLRVFLIEVIKKYYLVLNIHKTIIN